MADISLLVDGYKNNGYSEKNAKARVSQDIVLKAIAESTLSRNITIKGGVVMRSITGDVRRATQDMDLDFIKYSLDELSIYRFVDKLNCLEGITIKIIGDIEELSQQEYSGKRIFVSIVDEKGYSLISKIDLGVHNNLEIEQEEYCFDICMDEDGVYLLINSKEQIFAEKLRSLLKFGPLSTRYKDVFDLCYLTEYINLEKLKKCIKTYILDDPRMKENDYKTIRKRVSNTFSNKVYRKNIEKSNDSNWLRIKTSVAFERIEVFLENM